MIGLRTAHVFSHMHARSTRAEFAVPANVASGQQSHRHSSACRSRMWMLNLLHPNHHKLRPQPTLMQTAAQNTCTTINIICLNSYALAPRDAMHWDVPSRFNFLPSESAFAILKLSLPQRKAWDAFKAISCPRQYCCRCSHSALLLACSRFCPSFRLSQTCNIEHAGRFDTNQIMIITEDLSVIPLNAKEREAPKVGGKQLKSTAQHA